MPIKISTIVQKDNYKYQCKKTLGHNLSNISTKCSNSFLFMFFKLF